MKKQVLIVSNLDNAEIYSKCAINAGYHPHSYLSVLVAQCGSSEVDREDFAKHIKGSPTKYDALITDSKAEHVFLLLGDVGWGGDEHPIIWVGETTRDGVDIMVSAEGLEELLRKMGSD